MSDPKNFDGLKPGKSFLIEKQFCRWSSRQPRETGVSRLAVGLVAFHDARPGATGW